MPRAAALVLTSLLNGPSNSSPPPSSVRITGFCESSESCMNYLRGFEDCTCGISANYGDASCYGFIALVPVIRVRERATCHTPGAAAHVFRNYGAWAVNICAFSSVLIFDLHG